MKYVEERQILYDITYMWNLKKNTNEYIYIYAKSSRLTDIKSKLVITKGEKKEGRDELGVCD